MQAASKCSILKVKGNQSSDIFSKIDAMLKMILKTLKIKKKEIIKEITDHSIKPERVSRYFFKI